MKALISHTFLFSLLLYTCTADIEAQTWHRINHKPQTATLNSVTYASPSLAVAVGEYGAIHRSEDRGASWSFPQSGTGNHLRAVSFLNENVGIIAGDSGTVLRTSDGGLSWNPIPSGTSVRLTNVTTSGSTVIAAGADGLILRSESSGLAWSETSSPSSDTLYATGTDGKGFFLAVGNQGVVLRSLDNGKTWERVESATAERLRSVVVLSDSVWIVAGEGNRVYRTVDAGNIWTSVTLQAPSEATEILFVNDMYVHPSGRGVLVGEVRTPAPFPAAWYVTADSGRSWERQNPFNPGHGLWIDGLPTGEGLVVGHRGSFSGTNLDPVTGQFSVTPLGGIGEFRYTAISCSDANNCTAIGKLEYADQGVALIERTTDGGKTWIEQTPAGLPKGTVPGSFLLQDVIALDSLNVIVVGDSSTILRTVDAGTTWSRDDYPVAFETHPEIKRSFRNISFGDSRNGVIASDLKFLLRTSDGGESWRVDTSLPPSTQNLANLPGAVQQLDGTTTLVVEFYNRFYRTQDLGEQWEEISIIPGPRFIDREQNAFSFHDARHGWFAGRYESKENPGDAKSSILLHTTDGGETWEIHYNGLHPAIGGGMTTVAFADAQNGVVAGDGQAVLRTTDGGKTWDTEPVSTEESPIFICVDIACPSPTKAIAVTRAGEMLIRKDNGISSADHRSLADSHESPSISLSLIAPNPASHSVRFSATWPGTIDQEGITISVYDMQGKKVEDLTPLFRANTLNCSADFSFRVGYPEGTYIVMLSDGEHIASGTLMVAHP